MPKRVDDETVYEACVKYYAKNGFAGTNTKAIADVAGVNEVTVFRRYGSKLELLKRSFEYVLTNAPIAQLQYQGDLDADIESILRAYHEVRMEYGNLILGLLYEASIYPELASIGELLAEKMQNAASILEEHREAGDIVGTTAFDLLIELLSPDAMNGLILSNIADRQSVEPDFKRATQRFLDGRRY